MRVSGLTSMMQRTGQCARKANEDNSQDADEIDRQIHLEKSLEMLCEDAESLASVVAYQKQHSQTLADLVGQM